MNGNGVLAFMVRSYYTIQRTRISMGNMASAFWRGVSGPREDTVSKAAFITRLEEMSGDWKAQEEEIARDVAREIKRYPVWTEWLSRVKGCGEMLGAVIITEFNIEIATTVSKMWQFAGLNPGMVRGWKSDGKDKDGWPKWKITEDMIRGDRLTPGYRSPFNKRLRTALCGKLGPSILKAQGEYAISYYYPMHVPKDRRDELGPGRYDVEEGWKDKSEGHRSRAAIRYMIKAFVRDLYVAWRTLEGLSVREPYAEEYLGKQHSA